MTQLERRPEQGAYAPQSPKSPFRRMDDLERRPEQGAYAPRSPAPAFRRHRPRPGRFAPRRRHGAMPRSRPKSRTQGAPVATGRTATSDVRLPRLGRAVRFRRSPAHLSAALAELEPAAAPRPSAQCARDRAAAVAESTVLSPRRGRAAACHRPDADTPSPGQARYGGKQGTSSRSRLSRRRADDFRPGFGLWAVPTLRVVAERWRGRQPASVVGNAHPTAT